MSVHFNKGPAYGLSAEVNRKIAQKYDPQKDEDIRRWIEDVTGVTLTENLMDGLKNGVVLCKLINKLQPGSVKKINESPQNWHQLENIGNFLKAIAKYGVKLHDSFEANDLYENCNLTQVQTTLMALASLVSESAVTTLIKMPCNYLIEYLIHSSLEAKVISYFTQAKTKGYHTKSDIGVRYAEKQQRVFNSETLKAGQNIIGLQMGTNKFASQQGMTAYGTRRHLYDPKTGVEKPLDQTTISLQMGTNKGATQAGMTAPGTRRHIVDNKLGTEKCDSSIVSLQMGTNQGASQKGMTVYGLSRQVFDPKYCSISNFPNDDGILLASGSECSEGDYPAEYKYNQHTDANRRRQIYQDFE
ncbi:calponin-1 isoform X1 [Pristis pectinata]|uniref:calponin-1 isoform X1 n=1 Tax=Pristis pectinata TaxID=685728 RepID=UPI00223E5097|nr:calponin-1 isoform X1 [Pristis pectinata]